MNSDRLPDELKERRQWLCWRFINKPGQKKPAKMPYYATTCELRGWPHGKPRNGEPTAEQPQVEQGHDLDRQNLVDFETAMEVAALRGFDGVGFAFLPGDGLIGIDLDAACADKHAAIRDACGTFAEVSPSGTGIHIIGLGTCETFKSNDVGVEVFCGRQFFTVTGQHDAASPLALREIPQDALAKLRRTVERSKEATRAAKEAARPAHQPSQQSPTVVANAEASRYCLGALESAVQRLRAAAEGGRNDLLNGEAYGLAQLIHTGGISEATIRAALQDAALSCGLPAGEAKATISSGIRAGQQSPRPIPARQRPAPTAPRPALANTIDPETGEILDEPPAPAPANDNEGRAGFSILGYDRESFYFLPHEKRQITEMTRGDMTENGLLALAPMLFWEVHFPKEKARYDKTAAVDWLIRTAYSKGVFNPHRIRGRGAWIDDGRTVVHMGSHLIVENAPTDITGFGSRYIYQAEIPLPDLSDDALTSEEGEILLETSEMFRWTMPASAALLSGWCALAPICGASRWRPHIWLTGGAGCGKSTILNDFVHFLMGGMDVFAQGNSTEAGLRQKLRSDALPVLFDESEQNNEREEQRVQSVLALIRQASSESGAQTFKGTVGGKSMHFHVRSMFCLASIQVGIKQQADRERLTVLALRPKHEDRGAADGWERLRDNLRRMRRDEGLPGRLFRRSLDLLPVTLRNIDVFVRSATEHFGNARDGDQYGTLLAGAWSLIATQDATAEDAAEMIGRYDWTEYTESNHADDAMRALQALIESRVRVAGGTEYTVAELVGASIKSEIRTCPMEPHEAQAILRRHGLKTAMAGEQQREWALLISNNSPAVRELVAGTPFESDLRGQLLRVDGAFRHASAERFTGPPAKCIGIPVRVFA